MGGEEGVGRHCMVRSLRAPLSAERQHRARARAVIETRRIAATICDCRGVRRVCAREARMCMWPCHSHGTSLLLCVRAVCVCGSAACYVFIAARAACARALISAADRIDFPYTTYKISPPCVSVCRSTRAPAGCGVRRRRCGPRERIAGTLGRARGTVLMRF